MGALLQPGCVARQDSGPAGVFAAGQAGCTVQARQKAAEGSAVCSTQLVGSALGQMVCFRLRGKQVQVCSRTGSLQDGQQQQQQQPLMAGNQLAIPCAGVNCSPWLQYLHSVCTNRNGAIAAQSSGVRPGDVVYGQGM